MAGGAAAFNLPFYAILVLPILFAAGMCLMDTTDGVFMNAAYGWAFAKPVRKVFYNMTITSLSVAVALIIGTIELISVLVDQAHIESGPLAWVANIPLDYAGYAIVGLFVVSWLVALAIWRLGRIEEKWSARLAPCRRPGAREPGHRLIPGPVGGTVPAGAGAGGFSPLGPRGAICVPGERLSAPRRLATGPAWGDLRTWGAAQRPTPGRHWARVGRSAYPGSGSAPHTGSGAGRPDRRTF